MDATMILIFLLLFLNIISLFLNSKSDEIKKDQLNRLIYLIENEVIVKNDK